MEYLCEPTTHAALELEVLELGPHGDVETGVLRSPAGDEYPIVRGVPRFVGGESTDTVESFSDEWNYFNFTDFKENWLTHTVRNTFGTTEAFRNRVIVDAGGGSGAQSRWFVEAGAARVILLDLSDAVDGVIQRNVGGFENVAVVQCSIDDPPIRPESIDGIVYCHNVIQHTPSVERTARALFDLVGAGGEFVFNCYPTNDGGMLRWVRFHWVYEPLRAFLSKRSFRFILNYARVMSWLRLVPGLGFLLEKGGVCVRGDVPTIAGEGWREGIRRKMKITQLNTYDGFGYHEYQHHLSDEETRTLLNALQPDCAKVVNAEEYLQRDRPIGCAVRVRK